MRLDTSYNVNTPEGITLRLSPAGPVPRTLAWLIDLSIRSVLSIFLLVILVFLGNLGIGLAMISIFLLEWFYPVWFELRHHGQTPGKKMLQLRVAQADGAPVSPAASMIRNLLRVADFLPLMYGAGLVSLLLTRRFQRLGDLAAGTVVLHNTRSTSRREDFQYIPRPPEHTLTLPEQQALILFAQRQHTLTPERQQELAALTGPLVSDTPNPAAHLRDIAGWLMGQKT
ncbi:MAG: RDD family protein [Thiothrix sp.]|nr:RDD family protein [Thiothrix sp.]HPE59782.1 RDD family protein [Thiolinea sp.]